MIRVVGEIRTPTTRSLSNDHLKGIVVMKNKTAFPILVSLAAALLFGISIFLVIRKRVLRNFIEEIKRTREAVKRERYSSMKPERSLSTTLRGLFLFIVGFIKLRKHLENGERLKYTVRRG